MNARDGQCFVRVDLEDLMHFDTGLHAAVKTFPNHYVSTFEEACMEVFRSTLGDDEEMPYDFQIQFMSLENPRMLRDLHSNQLNKLVVVPGIITSASKSMIKATRMGISCRNCGHKKQIDVNAGLGGTVLPRQCDRSMQEKCPLDPYRILPDESTYKDHQTLKI